MVARFVDAPAQIVEIGLYRRMRLGRGLLELASSGGFRAKFSEMALGSLDRLLELRLFGGKAFVGDYGFARGSFAAGDLIAGLRSAAVALNTLCTPLSDTEYDPLSSLLKFKGEMKYKNISCAVTKAIPHTDMTRTRIYSFLFWSQ